MSGQRDEMILVVDNGSSSARALVDAMRRLSGRVDSMTHEQVGELDGYSGVVLSGRAAAGKASNVNNARILRAAEREGTPILGICYGCEALALTFGGTLRRLESRTSEMRKVEVLKNNRLMRQREFLAYESHGFVVSRLPKTMDRLAASSVSVNEAFRVRGREIYGVQFHPELSGESGMRILRNFVEICANRLPG
ncbi:MAG: gamma-glutamyl-gamma-aminobutyrate hydrolase family protein [Thaumarchaeota archaeon]|nr:gamma-glutamyl-gamma-aminobutyrate hydrolase family protein [Nitrososphaerota archaeon]